jgi:hypothetical protein
MHALVKLTGLRANDDLADSRPLFLEWIGEKVCAVNLSGCFSLWPSCP